MIQFSIPTALGIFAASSAVAVTSVAVAVPAFQPAVEVNTTSTPTATQTATPTAKAAPGPVGDSPLSAWGNHEVGNGVMLHDLAMGLTAHVNSSGVTFSYVGPCQFKGSPFVIYGNNGQQKSSSSDVCGGALQGEMSFNTMSLTWNEDIRNSYCYSPLGGASAYRAEVFGMATEWIPIPAEYMQCVNGQVPEGPAAPAPIVPAEPAPEPSPTDSSSPAPSESATP